MRRALWGLAILAVLAAGGAYLAYNFIDVIVKLALEHWGPDVTGTPVAVEQVQISPRDGRGSIRGLEVGNPAGFAAKRAARFGEIRVALDPSTVTDPVIVIRELAITSPQITYERGEKRTNIDAIHAHIESYAKRTQAEEPKGPGGASRLKRRFIIERLDIRGARVLMTSASLKGQGLTFQLPDVQMRDVGKREGGVSASEAAAQVAGVLQNRIAQRVLTNVDTLRKGGVEGAVDALKGLLK